MSATDLDDTVMSAAECSEDNFDRKLLERMLECNKKIHAPYAKAVAGLDWEKVAFDEHTAEECRQRWEEILARLRVHRTLSELIDDALASRWDPFRVRRALRLKRSEEGAPTKPPSVYIIFSKAVRPKLKRKHPNLSQLQLLKLMGKKYAALPPEKLAVYVRKREQLMQEYEAEMEKFRKTHPELAVVEHPPKRPPGAVEIYCRKHPDLSKPDARAAYQALSNEGRLKYIRKAKRARDRYLKQVEEYQVKYPKWKASVVNTISQKEQRILEKAEGKPTKPKRAYDLFMAATVSTLHDVPVHQRMPHCAMLWRQMDAAARAPYIAQAEQSKQRYQEYLSTLAPEDRPVPVKRKRKPRPVQRKRKRLTAKELFVKEKMPDRFETLSEKEWRGILTRKFARLSQEDKDEYARRAANMSTDENDSGGTGISDRDRDSSRVITNGNLSPTDIESMDHDSIGEGETEPEPESEPKPKRKPEPEPEPKPKRKPEPEPELEPELEPERPQKKRKRKAKDAAAPAATDSVSSDAATDTVSRSERCAPDGIENGPSNAYEYFIQGFLRTYNTNHVTGLSPKKIQKKGKRAWKSLTEDQRRNVEKSFREKFGR